MLLHSIRCLLRHSTDFAISDACPRGISFLSHSLNGRIATVRARTRLAASAASLRTLQLLVDVKYNSCRSLFEALSSMHTQRAAYTKIANHDILSGRTEAIVLQCTGDFVCRCRTVLRKLRSLRRIFHPLGNNRATSHNKRVCKAVLTRKG